MFDDPKAEEFALFILHIPITIGDLETLISKMKEKYGNSDLKTIELYVASLVKESLRK